MKAMKILKSNRMFYVWTATQFGFTVAIGKNYEGRRYLTFDIPLLTFQFFFDKPRLIR
jgi:hypothetical protein